MSIVVPITCVLAYNYQTISGDADIIVKTGSDIWISARKSKSRVLFAIILQKNIHYISVVEDIRKLSLHLFNKAYFSEC